MKRPIQVQHDRRIPRDLKTLVPSASRPERPVRLQRPPRDELRFGTWSRPTLTRPLGPAARFWRWCKRSPGLAAASILAALLTTTLVIGSTVAAEFRDQVLEHAARICSILPSSETPEPAIQRIG